MSHEEIRNLSTEELFSYIENEGKKRELKQAAAGTDLFQSAEQIAAQLNDDPDVAVKKIDSKQIQQMKIRLKAKAFMAQ